MPRYDTNTPIGIGDVIVTREGSKWISGAIRIGAALRGLPAIVNHVIIAHHQDDKGTMWGIEGRPGGVGWRDLSQPLKWAATNANNAQPKTEEQRFLIATAAEGLLATPYDWSAILEHTRLALTLWANMGTFTEWKDGVRPAHVVCSSLADWAYEEVGLSNPGGESMTRITTPAHWDRFMANKEWEIAR